MRVIIVESDRQFAEKAATYFEGHGDQVINESPTTLIDRLRHWQADLLLLSAESATEELMNAIRALRAGPAILLSEHMSRFQRAWSAWQRGGHELLMRPIFHAYELREAVTVALENAAVGTRGRTPQAIPA
jgi:DNA-binding response OmpR family regulator